MSLSVIARLSRPGFTLDVSLKAAAGVTALFGPSGSGKTTVARIVAGLERPEEAHIHLRDRDISRLPPYQRRIGMVFQDARLFPHRTVLANLLFGAVGGADAAAMAERLGISHLLDRRPGGLSGGEAARVALGRALLSEPDLLILDEPLAGLDQRRKADLLPYFAGLRDEGIPILFISHAIEEVAQLADTLVLLRQGLVQRAGPLAEILADPASASLVGPNAAGAVLTGRAGAPVAGLMPVETEAGILWVPDAKVEVGTSLRLRIPATDVMIATEPPTGLSAQNIIPATISALHEGVGPGIMLGLRAGNGTLLARISRRAMSDLGLGLGQQVWAVVKATTASRADIGRGTQNAP